MGAVPKLINCTFSENSSVVGGGGMCNRVSCSPTLTDCTFSENSTSGFCGGGMINDANSSPTLTNCTFSENSSSLDSGGNGQWRFLQSYTNQLHLF